MDPYVIVHDKCKFVDSQVVKLQEAPDMVPVGDLPRHTILNADRWLTNRVVPGMRAVIMGIYSIYQNKSAVSYKTRKSEAGNNMLFYNRNPPVLQQ
jgi:DNA replication licensing factor MCM5